jgi:hypothetical protein
LFFVGVVNIYVIVPHADPKKAFCFEKNACFTYISSIECGLAMFRGDL